MYVSQNHRNMKFLLAHPSYGRPQKAEATARLWYERATNKENIAYHICVETPEYVTYTDVFSHDFFSDKDLKMVHGNFGTCVSAANNAVLTGITDNPDSDIIILVSDDFECPENWDALLTEKILSAYGENHKEEKFAVQVSDGVVSHILTIPIISRAAYAETGYIYHPSYISMYADNDLRDVFYRHFKILEARDLVFRHVHWAHGYGTKDNTYLHQERPEAWTIGKQIYQKREAEGFPVK